jgi:hypothetical protein
VCQVFETASAPVSSTPSVRKIWQRLLELLDARRGLPVARLDLGAVVVPRGPDVVRDRDDLLVREEGPPRGHDRVLHAGGDPAEEVLGALGDGDVGVAEVGDAVALAGARPPAAVLAVAACAGVDVDPLAHLVGDVARRGDGLARRDRGVQHVEHRPGDHAEEHDPRPRRDRLRRLRAAGLEVDLRVARVRVDDHLDLAGDRLLLLQAVDADRDAVPDDERDLADRGRREPVARLDLQAVRPVRQRDRVEVEPDRRVRDLERLFLLVEIELQGLLGFGHRVLTLPGAEAPDGSSSRRIIRLM